MNGQARGASYAGTDQLVTGEAVALELPPASLGIHVVSGLIDVTIQVIVLIIGVVLAGLLAPDDALLGVASVLVVAFTLVLGPAILERLTMGRTVGKLVMGIRTVRDDAGPISFHHAFVRHLLSVIEIWVFSGVPALVSALVSSKGKRLGDHVAGTYVVRDRFSLRLPWPVQMPPAPGPLGGPCRHRAAAGLAGGGAAAAAGTDGDAEPAGPTGAGR